MNHESSPSSRRDSPAELSVPAGEIRILESHHIKGFQMKMDAWPFHKLCWVAMGSGWLESGHTSSPIRKGDFLALPASWQHRFRDDEHDLLTLVIFCISETFLKQKHFQDPQAHWHSLLQDRPTGNPVRANTAFHESFFVAGFRNALREQHDRKPGWQTVLQAEFSLLTIRMIRGNVKPSSEEAASSMQNVEGAIIYLNEHPFEPYRIEELAEQCGLSSRRFGDLFKQLTGLTFITYLNQRRIAYACDRLDETGHILYACHESGFNDLAYFYRVFKKVKGMTPGAYLES